MKTYIIQFKVDQNDRVIPVSSTLESIGEINNCRKVDIEILGDGNSSLIAIDEAANFIGLETKAELDFQFTKSDFIEAKTLIAVVIAL